MLKAEKELQDYRANLPKLLKEIKGLKEGLRVKAAPILKDLQALGVQERHAREKVSSLVEKVRDAKFKERVKHAKQPLRDQRYYISNSKRVNFTYWGGGTYWYGKHGGKIKGFTTSSQGTAQEKARHYAATGETKLPRPKKASGPISKEARDAILVLKKHGYTIKHE